MEERAQIIGVPEEKKYGDSPSGGGVDLIFLDGLALLQIDSSLGHLMRNFKRIWSYPPFVPPPLHILIKKIIQ
jgi:hypothetical protein